MARREEALTMEEENLQREMRETERSDNESEEWEDPGGATPVTISYSTHYFITLSVVGELGIEYGC